MKKDIENTEGHTSFENAESMLASFDWCSCPGKEKKERFRWLTRIINKLNPFFRYGDTYYDNIRDYFYPQNVIRLTSMDRHYHTQSDKMLHACFELLVEYVEKEVGLEDFPMSFAKDIERAKITPYFEEEVEALTAENGREQELFALYTWWKDRLKREDNWDVVWPCLVHQREASHKLSDEAWKKDEEWEKEDQEMFERLAKIRQYIWR
jgi:hypothetical protein